MTHLQTEECLPHSALLSFVPTTSVVPVFQYIILLVAPYLATCFGATVV